mgnify:CR=1 FL=1
MKFLDRYNSLSKFQKIELYSIPILIFVFLYINDFSLKNGSSIIKSEQKKELIQSSTKQTSYLEIAQYFESLAHIHNIKICALSIQDLKTIDIKFNGKINDLLNCLLKIEQSYDIDQLDFQHSKNRLAITLHLSQNLYNNNQKNLQQIVIKSPFEKMIAEAELPKAIKTVVKEKAHSKISTNMKIQKEIHQKENLEIQEVIDLNGTIVAADEEDMIEIFPRSKTTAIVGQYVLLNKNWLTLGDRYKGYTIVSITNEIIKFQNGNKEAIMEMFSND